jgi:hypothetical protein
MKSRKLKTKTNPKTRKYKGGMLQCGPDGWEPLPFVADPAKPWITPNKQVELYRQAEATFLNTLGLECTLRNVANWVYRELVNFSMIDPLFEKLSPNSKITVLNSLRKSIHNRRKNILNGINNDVTHNEMLEKLIQLRDHFITLMPGEIAFSWGDEGLREKIKSIYQEIAELEYSVQQPKGEVFQKELESKQEELEEVKADLEDFIKKSKAPPSPQKPPRSQSQKEILKAEALRKREKDIQIAKEQAKFEAQIEQQRKKQEQEQKQLQEQILLDQLPKHSAPPSQDTEKPKFKSIAQQQKEKKKETEEKENVFFVLCRHAVSSYQRFMEDYIKPIQNEQDDIRVLKKTNDYVLDMINVMKFRQENPDISIPDQVYKDMVIDFKYYIALWTEQFYMLNPTFKRIDSSIKSEEVDMRNITENQRKLFEYETIVPLTNIIYIRDFVRILNEQKQEKRRQIEANILAAKKGSLSPESRTPPNPVASPVAPVAAEAAVVSEEEKFCSYCGISRDAEHPNVKISDCSKCHDVRYCGRECQTQDWKTHKKNCCKP